MSTFALRAGVAHAGGDEPRVAAVDWAMLETALALGIVPVAATELRQYRAIAVEPAVPPGVADLGLRGLPNYEQLRAVAPGLILISGFYETMRAQFERIAPVFSATIYVPGEPPYARAEAAALALGERLGRLPQARDLVATAAAEIEKLRSRLRAQATRPVFVASIGDARHFRAFGADSMFGDVLSRLGFTNAWQSETRYSAAAPVGIEALAKVPDAALVVVEPVPPDARRTLAASTLWQALPMVKAGRVSIIPPVDHFGGLPAAQRFARLFAASLPGESPSVPIGDRDG